MFHFYHRAVHNRDAIDERRKNKPKAKAVEEVDEADDDDSDCERYGL
jgi:hypothetical protein